MSPGPVTLGKTLSWRLLLLDQRVDPVCLCPPGSTNRAEVLESMFSSLTLKGFPYILILFCPLCRWVSLFPGWAISMATLPWLHVET